jgi:hypothetical protein
MEEILKELIAEFPEWSEEFSAPAKDKVLLYQVNSPSGKTKLQFSYYDRLNIKFERESLEFWTVSESIDTLKDIVNEKLVSVEYILDRDLAAKLGQEVPDNIPEYVGGALVRISELPTKNNEWYFANTIRVTSWLGKHNFTKKAIYGR